MEEVRNFMDTSLQDDAVHCDKCTRLVEYRRSVKPKPQYALFPYHNAPVMPFGDSDAWLLIIGLAPGAHGANRTGRPFQGDGAGTLLYAALHDAGFCNHRDVFDFAPDLALTGAKITNACRCVPPKNVVAPSEFANCRPYLVETLSSPKITDVLCIGRNAYEQFQKVVGEEGPAFGHKVHGQVGRFRVAVSYHTSTYNQNTRRITLDDVVEILLEIRRRAGRVSTTRD